MTATLPAALIPSRLTFLYLHSPCCGEISNIFSTGGGEELAKRESIPFLGRLPVDTELVDLLDHPAAAIAQGDPQASPSTFPLLAKYKQTPSFALFSLIVRKIGDALSPPSSGELDPTGRAEPLVDGA